MTLDLSQQFDHAKKLKSNLPTPTLQQYLKTGEPELSYQGNPLFVIKQPQTLVVFTIQDNTIKSGAVKKHESRSKIWLKHFDEPEELISTDSSYYFYYHGPRS